VYKPRADIRTSVIDNTDYLRCIEQKANIYVQYIVRDVVQEHATNGTSGSIKYREPYADPILEAN